MVESTSQPVIALISSAGGFPAMRHVLADLPSDLSASVIVLQHTTPERPHRLAPLLARVTDMSVVDASDGAALDQGSIVVAPSGHHTLVTMDRRISLIMSGHFPPHRPSADLLLTSMALSLRSCAIAVVMSGGGSDGATGATAVHKHGGVVLATDQQTSEHFSMPKSAIERDQVVNEIVPVPDIAFRLQKLVAALT